MKKMIQEVNDSGKYQSQPIQMKFGFHNLKTKSSENGINTLKIDYKKFLNVEKPRKNSFLQQSPFNTFPADEFKRETALYDTSI